MTAKLYSLVKSFMMLILPVFYYQYEESCIQLVENVLDVYLDVWDANKYRQKLLRVILDTFVVQTKEDCNLLKHFDTSEYETENEFFELKKQIIEENELLPIQKFSPIVFFDALNKGVGNGNLSYCKIKAYLSWASGDEDFAKGLWERLAFWGDLDSVKAMSFCYKQSKNDEDYKKWEEVFGVLESPQSYVFPEESYLRQLSPFAQKVMRCIRCIRNLEWIKNKDYMYFDLLNYVIRSSASTDDIVFNLIRGNCDFNNLRKAEEEKRSYKIGF